MLSNMIFVFAGCTCLIKKNRIRRGLFKALSWVVLNCSIPVNFFKGGGGGGSLRPFEGSPRRRTSRGPLALDHTFNFFERPVLF